MRIGESVSDMTSRLGSVTEMITVPMKAYSCTFYVFAATPAKTIIAITDGSTAIGYYAIGTTYSGNGDLSWYSYKDNLGTGSTYAAMAILPDYSVKFSDVQNTGDLSGMSKVSYYITNALRAVNGISTLQWSSATASVALAHSTEMATLNYFDHTSPNYGSIGDRLNAAGIRFISCAENISAGFLNVFDATNGWYNSSGHRKNMLNSKYLYVGIGFAYTTTGDLGVYGTQDFYC